MTHKTLTICLSAVVLAGCASSAKVTKSPGPGDDGIRYYRPKPYLLVTPADATGRMVKLELQYMPDYNEEYSIHPKGRKPPAVALQDGWNLVAVGGPAPPPAAPAAAPPPPPAAGDGLKVPEFVMASSNIPIGFYEAVFDSKGQGGKYLKGWRYVGFSVWGGGNPDGIDPAVLAAQKANCKPGQSPDDVPAVPPQGSALQGPLYGIVFFNGAMTLRQIDEVAGNMTCPQYAKTIPDPVPVAEPPKPKTGGAPEPGNTNPPRTGGEATPPQPAPNPGTSMFHEAKPPVLEADSGVALTAVSDPKPTMVPATPSTPSVPAAGKTEAKSLADLEAEVFKKLNVSVPKATKVYRGPSPGSSSGSGSANASIEAAPIPDLSPATTR